jgi:hypothetical protein
VTDRKIRELLRPGELCSFKPAGRRGGWRIRTSEVDRYIRELEEGRGESARRDSRRLDTVHGTIRMTPPSPRARENYRKAEEAGRRARARWLLHPLVHVAVPIWRPHADDLCAPLITGGFLPDQRSVVLLLEAVLDLEHRFPDGSIERNVYQDLPIARLVARPLRSYLTALADDLEARDVPLDKTDAGDLLVLGQCLLLDVDWNNPKLADDLFMGSLGAWRAGDAGGLELSRLANTTESRRLLDLQQQAKTDLGRAPLTVGTGGRPHKPLSAKQKDFARRAQALMQAGEPVARIAAEAKVTERTIYRWVQRREDESS